MKSTLRTIACSLPLLVVFLLADVAPATAGGPFQFHSLTPCRVFDTRQVGAQTNGQPLQNPGPWDFRVQGICGVPNGAAATSLNVTITSPSAYGDLRLFPVGVPLVDSSTLNYPPGEPAMANGAIVPLGPVSQAADKDLRIVIGMITSGTVHVILDVTGYFQ